jgi:hypothetical protein
LWTLDIGSVVMLANKDDIIMVKWDFLETWQEHSLESHGLGNQRI